jgi:photosystem II stability/assembly factor-like uncharacterized protein
MVRTNAIAGGDNGLWYSRNSGEIWTQSNKTDGNFSSVYMNGKYAIAGSLSNMGLFISNNYGQTWFNLETNKIGNFKSVCINIFNNAIAGSSSNMGIWYSDKLDKNFSKINNYNTKFIRQLDNIVVQCVDGGNARISIDSGNTWTELISPGPASPFHFNFVFIIKRNDNTYLNIASSGNNNGLLYNNDILNYPNNWTRCQIAGTNPLRDMTNDFGPIFGVYNSRNGNYSFIAACITGGNEMLWYSSNGILWRQSSKRDGNFNSLYMVENYAIAGGTTGLWYSNDYGANWIQSINKDGTNITENIHSVFMFKNYAIAGGDNGLLWSKDYGATWNKSNITDHVNSVYMFNNHAIAGVNGTIFYSSDFGKTWIRSKDVNGSTLNGQNYLSVYMDGQNAIAGSNYGFRYSIDYGITWTELIQERTEFNTVYVNKYGTVYAGSNNGLWNYNDIKKFKQVENTIDTFKFIKTSKNNAIASKLDKGLWYSIDNCTTWIQSNTDNIDTDNFYSVFMVEGHAIACSENIGLLYSDNGGQTWTVSNKIDDSFKSVYMVETNAIACSYSNTGLWYSNDSGKTWIQSNKMDDSFNSVFMVGTNAIACGNNGIWKSTDYGQIWEQCKIDGVVIKGIFNSVYIVGTNVIAVGIGVLYYSTDTGQNWTISIIDSNIQSIIFNSVFMLETHAIVSSDTGLWYSNDSGVNWTESKYMDKPIIGRFDSVYMDINGIGYVVAGGDETTGIWYSTDYGQTFQQSNIKNILSISKKTYRGNIIVPDNETINIIFDDYDELYIGLDNLKFKPEFSYILQNTDNLKNYLIDLNIIKFNVCDLRNFLDENINNLYILCTYIYKNVKEYLDKIKNNYKEKIRLIKKDFTNFDFKDTLFETKYNEILKYSKILNDIYINIKDIFSSVNKIIKNGNEILSIDYISNPTNNIVFNKFNLIPIENFSDKFDVFYSKYINNQDKFKEYLVSNFFMEITDDNYNIITIDCPPTIQYKNIIIDKDLLQLVKNSLDNLIEFLNSSFYKYNSLKLKYLPNESDNIEQYYYDCIFTVNKIYNSLKNIINIIYINEEQLLKLKNNINILETYNFLKIIVSKYLDKFNNFIMGNEVKLKEYLSDLEFNKIRQSLKFDLKYTDIFNINEYDVIKLLKQLYTQKIIELNSIYPKVEPIPQSVYDTDFVVGYNTNYSVNSFEYDPNKIIVSKFTNIGQSSNSQYLKKDIITDTSLICVEYIDTLLCKIYKSVLEQFKTGSTYNPIEIKIDEKLKNNTKIEKLYDNIKESNYEKFFEDKTKLAINLHMQEKIYAEILDILEKYYSDTFIISDPQLILSNTSKKLYNKEINKHFIKYDNKEPKLNKGTSNKLIRGKCYSNPKLLEQMIEYKFNFFTEDVNKSTILYYLIDERNNKAIEELTNTSGLNPHIFMVKNNSNLTPEQYVEDNIKLLNSNFSDKIIKEKISSFEKKLIKRINEDEQFGDIGIKDNSTNISDLLNTIIQKFLEKYESEDETKLKEFDILYKNYHDLEKYEDCEFNELNYFIVELLRNELCNGMIEIFKDSMIEYLYEECKKDSTTLLNSNSNTIKEFLHVSIYSKLKIQNPDITYRDPKDYIRELSRNFIRNLDLPELDTCLNNVLLMYKILVEEMSSFVYKMVIDISNDYHEIYLLTEIKKIITSVQTGITDNMKIAETKKNENEKKRLKELDDMKEKFKPKVETKS